MPRILFIDIDSQAFLQHRSALACAAVADGYEVHVALPDDRCDRALEGLGLTVHRSPIRRGRRPIWKECSAALGILVLIRRLRPDLLHLRTIKVTIYGGLSASLLRVPGVITLVTGLGSLWCSVNARRAVLRALLLPWYKGALSHPRQIVALENADDQRTLVRLGLVARRKTVVIPGSGVDLLRYPLKPEPPGPITVVMPCRMLWDKGVGVFVEAAHRLSGLRPQARFVLVGGVDTLSDSAIPFEQLRAWHDSQVVEWWGIRDDMPRVYAQAHAVCLPSVYGEGIPMALLEGMASGRPIITTDSTGCREACQHDLNGLLVPPQDPDALARALERIIGDAHLRQRLGEQGRRLAQEVFAIDLVNATCLKLFAQLANPRH